MIDEKRAMAYKLLPRQMWPNTQHMRGVPFTSMDSL